MKITAIVLSIITGVSLAYAQANPLLNLVSLAQTLVGKLIPLMMATALLVFFYGLVMFIWKGKEGGEALEKGKQLMIYSIVALFVMVSIWGIIQLMQSTLLIDPSAKPKEIYIPGSQPQQ